MKKEESVTAEKSAKKEQVAKETKKPEKTKDCEDCQELDNKYKRALADYQNLLKRTAKEKEEFFKYSSEQLITEFIPVYDNLKMSLNHTDEQIEKNDLFVDKFTSHKKNFISKHFQQNI